MLVGRLYTSLRPYPVDDRPAVSAGAFDYCILNHAKPDPPDERLATTPAERVLAFSRDVALIDIPEPGVEADLTCPFERFGRGGSGIGQLIGRMEPGDMPGNFFSDGADESGYLPEFGIRIVMSGNDERGDLDPDAGLFIVLNGIKHRGEAGAADLPVKIIGERLQVDIGRIEDGPDHAERFGGYIPVRHEHVPESGIFCAPGRVIGKFKKYRRLGVGIGDAGATDLLRGKNDGSGRYGFSDDPPAQLPGKLRDVRVLTVPAPEVAARRGNGIGLGSWQKMKERFFFYGIDVLSNDLVVNEAIEDTVLILPHGAQSQLAVTDTAAV